MSEERRLADITCTLFSVVTIMAFAYSVLIDNSALRIHSVFRWPLFMDYAICAALFSFQLFVVASVTLKKYSPLVAAAVVPYAVLAQAMDYYVLQAEMLYGSVVPAVLLLTIAAFFKDVKWATVRFAVLYAIMSLHYVISSFVKTGAILIGYNPPDATGIGAIISIDMIALLCLIYWKGCVSNERGYFHVLERRKQGISFGHAPDATISEGEIAYRNAKGAEWVVSRILFWGSQAFQFAVISVACSMIGLLPSGLTIAVAFAAYGVTVITNRWHPQTKTDWHCFFVCAGTGAIIIPMSARLIPEFQLSWYIPIVAGLMLCIINWMIKVEIDINKSNEKELAAIKAKPPFSCRTATPEELRRRCLERGIQGRHQDMVADHYSGNMTHKEIGDKYGIAEKTSIEYKRALTKKLELEP